jgi:hypothetical protein
VKVAVVKVLLIALPEVKSANAIDFVRTLRQIAQRTNGVIIAGMPMFLHGPAGELVVLCDAFISLCVIDQVNDAAYFVIGLRLEGRLAVDAEKAAIALRCRFLGKRGLLAAAFSVIPFTRSIIPCFYVAKSPT